jgi:hypothetical protein
MDLKYTILSNVGAIDQIAFGCKTLADVEQAKLMMASLFGVGEDDWSEDEVKAAGTVFGEEAVNVARLFFCYKLGIEFELLCYLEGDSWLADRYGYGISIVPSHLGIHVESVEEASKHFAGRVLAQEVRTQSHTNPFVIEANRRYLYRIFDFQDTMPFDVKLIERLNADG